MTAVFPSSSPAALLIRARGLCPPSLLSEDRVVQGDGFDGAVVRMLDGNNGRGGFSIRSDLNVVDEFENACKMAANISTIPGDNGAEVKVGVLEQRRCILLAMVGCTPRNNVPLKCILSNGFLVVVKSWLDDILSNTVGGVDLLLHLLSNISTLPVTKEMVTSSKLGKAVSAVEKHRICTRGRNAAAIKERIAKVKERWSASVKVNKQKTETGSGKSKNSSSPMKRMLEATTSPNSPLSKKIKTEEERLKKDSLSILLKKVSKPGGVVAPASNGLIDKEGISSMSAADLARLKSQERDAKFKARLAVLDQTLKPNIKAETNDNHHSKKKYSEEGSTPPKKQRHIKWADKSGGDLSTSRVVEVNGEERKEAGQENNGTWSDRRKRDRLREKELLAHARKSKIVDKDDSLDAMAMMVSGWRKPQPLPADPENPPVTAVSKELALQVSRMASVLPANYLSEEDVPDNPTPLSDIEQALDMTSQSSSVPAIIPFFAPQQETESVVQPIPVQQQSPIISAAVAPVLPPPPPPPPAAAPATGASIEMLQSMGLPLFLVGSNIQALQTLAASPSLLNTFIDGNGMYDQARLIALIQTLTQNLTPAAAAPPPAPVQLQTNTPQTIQHGAVSAGTSFQSQAALPPPPPHHYGPAQTPFQSNSQSSSFESSRSKQGSSSQQGRNQGKGYRGEQNVSEGNLHLTGYGPSTTQADIIALFSPYVQISEVVQKSGFAFVNTHDPVGARRAKDALSGTLLGGRPLRINIAMRRTKDLSNSEDRVPAKTSKGNRNETTPLPRNSLGQVEYEKVRDDRGNPATKNLFVAGYGSGTTESELREVFGKHASVTGVVLKGSFSFVNTSDRISAVHAREALVGTVVKGGVLRINFAKESGRLGTSFDTTYGPGAQQRYGRSNMH